MADLTFLTDVLDTIVENIPSNQLIEVHFIYNNNTSDVKFYTDKNELAVNIADHCSAVQLDAVEFLTRLGYYYKLTQVV